MTGYERHLSNSGWKGFSHRVFPSLRTSAFTGEGSDGGGKVTSKVTSGEFSFLTGVDDYSGMLSTGNSGFDTSKRKSYSSVRLSLPVGTPWKRGTMTDALNVGRGTH